MPLTLIDFAIFLGVVALAFAGISYSQRQGRIAMEYAQAAGYAAGVHDMMVVARGENLAEYDRPWADDAWYLKHCAGAVNNIDPDLIDEYRERKP